MSHFKMLISVVSLLASLAAILLCLVVLGTIRHTDHLSNPPLPVAEEAHLVNLCDSEGQECRPVLYHPFGDPFVFD